jgi:serine/threonine protein kinase
MLGGLEAFMDEDRPTGPSAEDLETADSPAPPSGAPRPVGPYHLLEKLGEGGMGEVWLAEQTEPVKRRVALKVIRQGVDTKQFVARFETERQALGRLDEARQAETRLAREVDEEDVGHHGAHDGQDQVDVLHPVLPCPPDDSRYPGAGTPQLPAG